MQGNVLGQVNGRKINGIEIYQQLSEPTRKDGIWIKTSEKVEDIYMANCTELTETESYDAPFYISNNIACIDSDIYMFGCEGIDDNGSGNLYNYKFDTKSNTFTELSTSPFASIEQGKSVSIGTDIYMTDGKVLYKYDTLTDTYALLGNIPSNLTHGFLAIFAYENKIYITSSDNFSYMYDIESNKFKTIPIEIDGNTHCKFMVNEYIYSFYISEGISKNKISRYNVKTGITDVFSENYPYPFTESKDAKAIKVRNNIYILGTYNNRSKRFNAYIYIQDGHQFLYTHTSIDEYANPIVVENLIYTFNLNQISKYEVDIEHKPNSLVIISEISSDANKLTENVLYTIKYNDDNTKEYMETYIGDGEKWNRLK